MIYLDIRGFGARKKLCKDVIDYFFEKYLPRHKVSITVQHRGLIREGVYGWCNIDGDVYNPREFLIEIHNLLNKETYIKTLFHECTHILQHVRGDLKERAGKQTWKGMQYNATDYESLPWEQEALENEDMLYHEYLTWG
jgi:hypothetical protein